MKKYYKWVLFVGLFLIFFSVSVFQAQGQVFPGNYDPTNLFPISYYYTNPLLYTDYGYVNSIIEPFYYIGYGYFPPISGNNLLGYYRVDPFLNYYNNYLYNYFGFATYPYIGSPYTTTYPFNTLPGTMLPYTRFSYPSFVYGSPSYYLNWVLLQ